MKVVADSDVLIKLTKTGSKEVIVSLVKIFIPKRVYEETVTESKGYIDANKIRENIKEGKIQVAGLSMCDKGEIEALKLYKSGGFELIVSDDKKFLNYLERNDIPYLTSSSLIVYLLYKNKISKEDTIKYIDNLKMYISKGQYLTAMSEVQRWET
jgi:predicted nucleic acid-binding protein